jgi:tight adherence protein B
MTGAVVLAGLAGGCAVLAAWEALVAVERADAARTTARWLEPALTALRRGREPSSADRRRLAIVGGLSLLAAGWLLAGPLAGVALAAGGPALVTALLRARRGRRERALARAAPAVARVLGDALAGGHSIRGAVAEAAAGGGLTEPGGDELRIAAEELALGERTDAALSALARRCGGGAYDTIVAAVLLQRDAGGDLAGLLRSLAAALEERVRVEADARSLTAQARFTATVVTALPLAGVALGELAQPGFVLALAASPLTALLAGAALVLQVVALLAVRRIARAAEDVA